MLKRVHVKVVKLGFGVVNETCDLNCDRRKVYDVMSCGRGDEYKKENRKLKVNDI